MAHHIAFHSDLSDQSSYLRFLHDLWPQALRDSHPDAEARCSGYCKTKTAGCNMLPATCVSQLVDLETKVFRCFQRCVTWMCMSTRYNKVLKGQKSFLMNQAWLPTLSGKCSSRARSSLPSWSHRVHMQAVLRRYQKRSAVAVGSLADHHA